MLILLVSIRVVENCNSVDYTSIYKKEVFDMTYDECVNKAKDAARMGIIEYDQIDAYAQHLYNTHK